MASFTNEGYHQHNNQELRSLPAGATKKPRFLVRTAPRFVEGQYTYGILLTDTGGNELDNHSFTFNVVAPAGP